jgi:hypothetical protein
MTKRDFFIALIKVFGLYSAVTALFSGLPSNVMFGIDGEIDIFVYFWVVAATLVIAALFWFLTFKADKLSDWLKLEKGFSDERIDFGHIKSEDIIKTGIFIIGGLLIVQNVSNLLSQLIWALKMSEAMGQEFTMQDKFNLGVKALNVLLGVPS